MGVIELCGRAPTIQRERFARKHKGQYVAWILTDKFGQLLVCSQKLDRIQAYVNQQAPTPHDKVHVSGLYESLSSHGKITGGFYKNRWKLLCCPIEETACLLDEQLAKAAKRVLLTD